MRLPLLLRALAARARRARLWLHRRPFLTALIVLLLVAVPGYWRTTEIATDAHDAAERVDAVVVGNEQERLLVALDFCRSSNDARLAVRHAFETLFDELDRMGVRPDAVTRLRQSIPPRETTDFDCDADGELDDDDYR